MAEDLAAVKPKFFDVNFGLFLHLLPSYKDAWKNQVKYAGAAAGAGAGATGEPLF